MREHQGVRAVGTATVCENVSKPVGAITTRQNWPELAETRPLLANANEPDRFTIHNNNMNQRYILFRRTEVFYYEDKITGKQLSLRTKDEAEAKILLNAKNESFRQPILNLQIAKAYLMARTMALPHAPGRMPLKRSLPPSREPTSTAGRPQPKAKRLHP